MKVLFLSNHEVTLYYFRCELIERLVSQGNEVYVCQPFEKYRDYFEKLGCHCLDSKITQYGMNPVKELSIVKEYRRVMREIKPDVVLTFTIKPNLYGGIAAAKEKIPYISAITGIGGAFQKGALFRAFAVLMYRYSSRKASKLFFENKSNSRVFEKYKIGRGNHIVVSGAGVNLEKYPLAAYPTNDGRVRFLFVGRLMNDKGIGELLSAFKSLRKTNDRIYLDIVGWCEDECRESLDEALEDNHVVYHGWQEEVRPFYEKCDALVLPSYHEGMANVLLEAQATGRPVLASDIPGCREAFENGVTGFSFESKSVDSLEKAINDFLHLSWEERMDAGLKGRGRMEKFFDRNTVVDMYVQTIYTSKTLKNG